MIDNDRQQKGLADTYIHYFEAQAASTPEAAAAVFGGEELSFGELQRRSNQLARYLQMLGVVPEVLVAICLERSLDLLVALLAVWKSGGAYLPLDAAYPNERLAYLLEDSQAGLLITQPQFSPRFRGAKTPLLHLDEALCQAGTASSEKVHCPARAGNLAYVIYTSGSTGKPKGVEITHRSLLNHNLAILRAYELVGSDRVLQFASLSFDVSVEEIFPSWLSGAAVVLRDNDLVWSIPAFLNFVERQRISVLNLPTAYWHKWVGDLHEMRWPPSVRLVIIGGESASVESYRVWRKAVGPGVALINAYGPTEATITSTIYKAGPQDEALPIGAPLPNVRALVLGEDGNPVAADGIGQLYLGGQGVARGYRNRPGLTAERFITSPLPDAPPSERFYKTGDLVRLRSDGNLDFIGRVDRQIKIRGFRIELEEIEKALKSCAGLKDAVVQMREDPPGQKRLVAYYLPAKQPEPTVSDLLSRLREQLPAYMIPAQFVSLKSLPLTPAGKVDYRALPKPANVRPRMGQRPVEAQTETEQQVGLIWQEVLQIEGLGVRDNFFDLGGDSLLAMQVISRVRDAFGIELPLSRLFDAPTVEGLARRLDSANPDAPNGKELFSTGLPDAGGAPASFSQERLWLLHQMNPKTDAYNMAWALRLKGNLDVAALESALGEVLRRHDVLRTSFRYADGCLMQAIDGEARLEMAATTLEHVPAKQRESKLQQLLALEVRRPFDLAKAPLMRASLFKLSATESALLLVMHHAVSDGWSLAILFKDVQRFYEAFVSGSPPTQPAPALRYADYARWQRRYMSGPLLEREVSYWKQLLSGAPQQVAFPQDPLPAPEKPAALRQSLVFSSKTVLAATRLARSRRATPFMVLLTALAITLKKWTGATDLVIGTVTAGRSRREFEELVGCFINFLPLRLDLRGKETGEQVLLEARRVVLDAQSHQDCPFEQIVMATQPTRGARRNPLYNVALLWHNVPGTLESHSNALQITPSPIHPLSALLDLRFEAEPRNSQWLLSCEFDSGLFSQGRIAFLLRSFSGVLENLIRRPAFALEDFALGETSVRRWLRALGLSGSKGLSRPSEVAGGQGAI